MSLRTTLIISYFLLITATAGLIGYVSLRNGQAAAEELANKLQDQILTNVQAKLSDYLAMPHRMNHLNAAVLRRHPEKLADLEGLRADYVQQLHAFEPLMTIAVGTEAEGNYVGVGRRDGQTFESGLRDSTTDMTYRVFLLDDRGTVQGVSTESPGYDARTRAWYQAGVNTGQAAWSPIYVWASRKNIGLTAVLPAYDDNGALLGVQQSALSLDYIGHILRELPVGPAGQIFLMERSGLLVASAAAEAPVQQQGDELVRFGAAESQTPFVRTTASYLAGEFGNLTSLPNNYRGRLEVDGERYFLHATNLADPHGLDWILVVGLAEADFMAGVNANTRMTLLLGAAALLVATGGGIFIANRITRPVLALNTAARELAQGRWDQLVTVKRQDEVGELAVSFNQMARQLHDLFTTLEERVVQRTAALTQANERLEQEIAERKRMEEALRQYTLELDRRNQELDAFAHTVAHDLKSPVSAIIGFADYTIAVYDTMAPDIVLDSLRHITRSGHKLNHIIEALLLLSGVRQQQVSPQPLVMGSIVAETLQRLAPLIREYEARITLPEASAWPVALGYGPWIEEVWVNYLSNALKYGGRPPRVELGSTAPVNGRARFWVRDNGPGLRPEDRDRLFQPFARLGRVQVEGFGLGLSIVRSIVEKLGGEVGLTSEPGSGTVFFFSLPVPSEADGKGI